MLCGMVRAGPIYVFYKCSIRKSCRAGGTDAAPQDHFKPHGSREKMKPKLTDKAVCYAIRQREKGGGARVVAEELGVTRRHVQRLRAEHLRTGKAHERRPAGRPAGPDPSEQEISAVPDAHGKPEGVIRAATRLRKEGRGISRHKACKTMKSEGLVGDSPAKSRQREWVGHERTCPSAMRHTDRHAMKGPRMRGMKLDHLPGRRLAARYRRGAVRGSNPGEHGGRAPASRLQVRRAGDNPLGQRLLLRRQGRTQYTGRLPDSDPL